LERNGEDEEAVKGSVALVVPGELRDGERSVVTSGSLGAVGAVLLEASVPDSSSGEISASCTGSTGSPVIGSVAGAEVPLDEVSRGDANQTSAINLLPPEVVEKEEVSRMRLPLLSVELVV
jgi:hypothetical protein